MGEVAAAGRVLGLQTRRLAATITRGLDAASATIGEHRDDAVSITSSARPSSVRGKVRPTERRARSSTTCAPPG
jgi:hypothetical protein